MRCAAQSMWTTWRRFLPGCCWRTSRRTRFTAPAARRSAWATWRISCAVFSRCADRIRKGGGGREISGNYLIDNTRLVQEFGVQYRPYRERVLQIINEVREAEGLPPVRDRGPPMPQHIGIVACSARARRCAIGPSARRAGHCSASTRIRRSRCTRHRWPGRWRASIAAIGRGGRDHARLGGETCSDRCRFPDLSR